MSEACVDVSELQVGEVMRGFGLCPYDIMVFCLELQA